jgi:tetratricopeptide (TPR) repeat protein
MKRVIATILCFSGMISLQAQSVNDATQQLYYQRYESAEKDLSSILKQQPANQEALYWLTTTYIQQNKISQAHDLVQKAPATVFSTPLGELTAGTVFLVNGKKDSASIYFNEALKETKEKDPQILSAIARAEIEAPAGDASYAVDLLQKAIKRDKKNASYYVLTGDAYRKLSNGSEAYKQYQQAIQTDKAYAEAYHRIGEIFVSQKNPEMYLQYFTKAIEADPKYAPSLYKLYSYEFYHDAGKAKQYYQQYMNNSDVTPQRDYELADLMFINKEFPAAIAKAQAIISSQASNAQARLYKMIAYSYAELKDTSNAISYMQNYFNKEVDTNIIAKDAATMARFAASTHSDSLAMVYLEKATHLQKDSVALYDYYKQLAQYAANRKDFGAQANWLGKYYKGNTKATNLDLFTWGVAHFRAEEYPLADSVFDMYIQKYPAQSFGYYWEAKSKAAQDKDMKLGLAVPAYQKLAEILQQDTKDPNYQKWLVEAYGYLAAYQANTAKNYSEAVNYFRKVLEVDPNNEGAKKYITILEKQVEEPASVAGSK